MSIFKRSRKVVDEIEPKESFIEIEKNRNNPNFVILDVRDPNEYNKEHLENAHILTVKSPNFEDELEKMDKNKKYFVYCRKGKRGCKAAELMEKHGFNEVHNITGGIDKWKSKRLPVNSE